MLDYMYACSEKDNAILFQNLESALVAACLEIEFDNVIIMILEYKKTKSGYIKSGAAWAYIKGKREELKIENIKQITERI